MSNAPASYSGIVPTLAVKATHQPARTETGIGALMPWADRLWFVTYVAHKSGTGGGTGLFFIDDDMTLHKHPASVVGAYANRMIHAESDQCIIGPHMIDTTGNVRTFKDLINFRITGTARHLTDPKSKVYMLGREGDLTLTVEPGGYACHTLPAGFSAHWVRLVADRDCTATAQWHYTSMNPHSSRALSEAKGRMR